MCSVTDFILESFDVQREPPEVFNLRPQVCNFIKKETLMQVFSCEFCEIPKNTFSTEQLRTTAFWSYMNIDHN